MHERIYVCHTFYHVYVTCLKELALREKASAQGTASCASQTGPSPCATLVLSKMSTVFGALADRARACGLFEEVIEFDEKRADFFPELAPLRQNTGSLFKNMINRIRFCKRLAELEAPYVPVDFRQYKDIYVFCDSDPVGYYLNANKISYHAVEDGLNCLKHFHAARFDNRGAFPVKVLLAKAGWLFIQNGYAKYCLDMEVNDVSVIRPPDPAVRYVEVPRQALAERLTAEDKRLLADLFVENMASLRSTLSRGTEKPRVLVLTERILEPEERKKLFAEIVSRYTVWKGKPALVFVKPHPTDEVDYQALFASGENGEGYGGPGEDADAAGAGILCLPSNFPMEVLNLMEELQFDAVVAVFTQTDAIRFAKERISLREEFAYAAPEIRQAAANAAGAGGQ